MSKIIDGIKVLLIAPKPISGEKLKECFKKLVAPGKYLEEGLKVGAKYPSFGQNVCFILAFGDEAEISDLEENKTYKKIWIKAEKSEGASEQDFKKDINNPDLGLAEQAIHLRNGLKESLKYVL